MNSSSGDADILFSAVNCVSVIICLLAAILVFAIKLHKTVVYRMALYQVLAALAFAMAELSEIMFFDYQSNPDVYGPLCIANVWFIIYFMWMKLLLTTWITFHLFCFAVLHKNLKKFEVLYVVTSLLVPAVVASIPLTTHSYGYSPITGCFIPVYYANYTYDDAAIEAFALWDGPSMSILFAASIAMVVMVIKLTYHVCWRVKHDRITRGDRDQFQKALKQLLPLAAFPVLFFVLIIPMFVYDTFYYFITPTPNAQLEVAYVAFLYLWTISSGGTLIVHITVAQLPVYCRKLRQRKQQNSNYRYFTFDNTVTCRSDSGQPMNSATTFPLPKESLVSN